MPRRDKTETVEKKEKKDKKGKKQMDGNQQFANEQDNSNEYEDLFVACGSGNGDKFTFLLSQFDATKNIFALEFRKWNLVAIAAIRGCLKSLEILLEYARETNRGDEFEKLLERPGMFPVGHPPHTARTPAHYAAFYGMPHVLCFIGKHSASGLDSVLKSIASAISREDEGVDMAKTILGMVPRSESRREVLMSCAHAIGDVLSGKVWALKLALVADGDIDTLQSLYDLHCSFKDAGTAFFEFAGRFGLYENDCHYSLALYAATNHRLDVLKWILGYVPGDSSTWGEVECYAALAGSIPICEWLMTFSPSPGLRMLTFRSPSGFSPVHHACKSGKLEMLNWLYEQLKKHSCLHALELDATLGLTPAACALLGHSSACLRRLCEVCPSGTHILQTLIWEGSTLAHLACRENDRDSLAFILENHPERSAVLLAKNQDGNTPLDRIVEPSSIELLECIMEHSKQVEWWLVVDKHGKTILERFVKFLSNSSVSVYRKQFLPRLFSALQKLLEYTPQSINNVIKKLGYRYAQNVQWFLESCMNYEISIVQDVLHDLAPFSHHHHHHHEPKKNNEDDYKSDDDDDDDGCQEGGLVSVMLWVICQESCLQLKRRCPYYLSCCQQLQEHDK